MEIISIELEIWESMGIRTFSIECANIFKLDYKNQLKYIHINELKCLIHILGKILILATEYTTRFFLI